MDDNFKLMQETMESADEYIDRVHSTVGNMVYNLQGGREDKAISVCADLFEGIKWLLECFRLTLPLQETKETIVSASDINPVTVQLEEALGNKDYVLLGDLLEYELLPVMEGWKKQIGLILGRNVGD